MLQRLLLASFFSCTLAFAQEAPWKTIELEWEEVPNAHSYEVRLTPKAGGVPVTFQVSENKLTQDVPTGIYLLRVRSRHKESDEVWSAWSDPIELEVLTKELIPESPKNGEVLTAQGDAREEVTFTWNKIEKARDYVLQIWTSETRDKPLTFVTRKNSQRLKLLPGRVYYWNVTFGAAGGVNYSQSVHTSTFLLQGQKLAMPSISRLPASTNVKELSWIGSPKAKSYKAKLHFKFLDHKDWKAVKEIEGASLKWSLDALKPGNYKLEVTALAPRYSASEKAVYEFTVKPTEAELMQFIK